MSSPSTSDSDTLSEILRMDETDDSLPVSDSALDLVFQMPLTKGIRYAISSAIGKTRPRENLRGQLGPILHKLDTDRQRDVFAVVSEVLSDLRHVLEENGTDPTGVFIVRDLVAICLEELQELGRSVPNQRPSELPVAVSVESESQRISQALRTQLDRLQMDTVPQVVPFAMDDVLVRLEVWRADIAVNAGSLAVIDRNHRRIATHLLHILWSIEDLVKNLLDLGLANNLPASARYEVTLIISTLVADHTVVRRLSKAW